MGFTRDRCAGGRFEPNVFQPINGVRRIVRKQAHHHWIDFVVCDALGIVVMLFRTVFDAGVLLQAVARSSNLARRPIQGAADTFIGINL